MSEVLSRIRRNVKFFHKSALASALLSEKASLLGLKFDKLKMDVVTRWNSAYEMVMRYLQLQTAVVAVIRSKELSNLRERNITSLSDDEAATAEDIATCLKPHKDITTMLCSETMPSASLILPLHYGLVGIHMNEKEGDSDVTRMMKQAVREDRYAAHQDRLAMISALDPRVKSLPFLSEQRFNTFAKLTTEAAGAAAVKQEGQAQAPHQPALQDLSLLPQVVETEEAPPQPAAATGRPEPPEKKPRSLLGNLLGDVYITHMEPAKTKMEVCSEEVARYKQEFPLPMDQNPLEWWKLNERRYPHLSSLAKCYLSIPATSVPAERVFSTAGDILTDKRAALKSRHVDRLIFFRKSMK